MFPKKRAPNICGIFFMSMDQDGAQDQDIGMTNCKGTEEAREKMLVHTQEVTKFKADWEAKHLRYPFHGTVCIRYTLICVSTSIP